jgi:hypothetical protein
LQDQADELESLCSLATQTKSIPVSPEHRKVLLFLISECERLATVLDKTPMPRQHVLNVGTLDNSSPPVELDPNGPVQMKLRDRADELRRLADAGNESVGKPKILSPQNIEDAGKVLEVRMYRAGRKGLRELMNEPDTTLALTAAWEHFIGPGTKDTTPQPSEFLKHFETRTGFKVPIRWEYYVVVDGLNNSPDREALMLGALKEYLQNSNLRAQLDSMLRGKWTSPNPQQFVETKIGYSSQQKIQVERKDDTIIFSSDSATVAVQDSGFNKDLNFQGRFCAVHFGPQRTFIALYGAGGSPFPLYCFDSQTGKLIWRTDVWGRGQCLILSGPHPFPDLIFAESRKEIVVFGKTLFCPYVEAFDIETGNPSFRFTPDHWCSDDTDYLASWRRNLRP